MYTNKRSHTPAQPFQRGDIRDGNVTYIHVFHVQFRFPFQLGDDLLMEPFELQMGNKF